MVLGEIIRKNRIPFLKGVRCFLGAQNVYAIKQSNYLDPSTGEVFYSQEQRIDLQFNERGYLFRKDKSCLKVFQDRPFPSAFSWAERGRIEALKYHIMGDDQLLVYRSDRTILPIGLKEICEITETSERQCKELIAKMKKHKIVKPCVLNGKTYFMFNPLYVFRGKRITPTVYIVFQDELKSVLPAWVIQKFSELAKPIK